MDSSGYQSLWTTITSTIAAIASAAAAILTWRQHRRGQRANDPVVELDAHWSSGKTFTGSDGMIMLQFRLRNYSTQSIVFKRIRVYRPKRSTIGRTISQNGRVTVTKSSSGEAPLRWDIGVHGEKNTPIGDPSYQQLFVLPPESWSGGELRIDLWWSRKSQSIRDNKVTLRRIIQQPAKIATEATNNA